MNCTNCFKIELTECPDLIKVYAGLLPNTDYAWLITDIHGNEYYEYFVSDNDGNFEIDTSTTPFPAGMFNHASGAYTLQVFQYYPYYYFQGEGETLTFCGGEYDSVLINFIIKSSSQDQSIQYIKCE